MGEKMDQIRLISFIKGHKKQIGVIQATFVEIFNECGKKYDSEAIQLGLTGSVIGVLLKNTNIPKEEQRKMLENLCKKFK